MFDFLKKNRKDVTKKTLVIFIFVILVTCLVLIFGATYAANSYTIVFNRAEGNEVMKTCYTDAKGKLDADCINVIGDVCSEWSTDKYYGTPQKNGIHVSKFADMTFTGNKNYYCVGNSSGKYNMGCYVCKADEDIMHWAANGDATDECKGGYYKSTVITKEGKCVTKVPESCYVCKSDKNIMKWDNNGDPNKECSAGFIPDPDAKSLAQCKTVVKSEACYACRKDETIMKWYINGDADAKCPSGYTKTIIPKHECGPVVNPPTNDILIFIVWAVGIASVVYSLFYFKNAFSKR